GSREDAGLAIGGEFQFVAESVGEQVARGGAGAAAGHADDAGSVIGDCRHDFLLRRVPPFVGEDAVAAAVAAGKQGGVAGRREGVGVVVVTTAEPGAAIHQHAKSVGAELVVGAFQIVGAKLVNDENQNEFRLGVIGAGNSGDIEKSAKEQKQNDTRHEGFHRELVYRVQSVGWSVGRSIGLSVCQSFGGSISRRSSGQKLHPHWRHSDPEGSERRNLLAFPPTSVPSPNRSKYMTPSSKD